MSTTVMRVLDDSGHRTITFSDAPADVAAARSVFAEQLQRGYLPFGGSSMQEPMERIDYYDEHLAVICWVRPLVGG